MASSELAVSFSQFSDLPGEIRAQIWDEFMSLEGSDNSRLVEVDIVDRNPLGTKERFNPDSDTWTWTTRDMLREKLFEMLRCPGADYRPRVGWHVPQPSVLCHVSREARAHARRRFYTVLLHSGEVQPQNGIVLFNPDVDILSQNFELVTLKTRRGQPRLPPTVTSVGHFIRRPLIHGQNLQPNIEGFHKILPIVSTSSALSKYRFGDVFCVNFLKHIHINLHGLTEEPRHGEGVCYDNRSYRSFSAGLLQFLSGKAGQERSVTISLTDGDFGLFAEYQRGATGEFPRRNTGSRKGMYRPFVYRLLSVASLRGQDYLVFEDDFELFLNDDDDLDPTKLLITNAIRPKNGVILTTELLPDQNFILLEVVDVDGDISWLTRRGESILAPTIDDSTPEEKREMQWLNQFDYITDVGPSHLVGDGAMRSLLQASGGGNSPDDNLQKQGLCGPNFGMGKATAFGDKKVDWVERRWRKDGWPC
ncbi:hypothetical protein QBC41DRAFT_305901 [Cercophora samala]|uniref:2EXR domain-containing protein n=1 Tax=Cercophora samala TaxID=330535 RepID=A0AA39Z7K6_9PEZI|nr:hypothetical protein QBC41DRAFT_305901 [Cercophora samala]